MRLTGQRNECPVCRELFNSNAAFTKHRVGSYEDDTRRCRTPLEMKERGMTVNRAGYWITSTRPSRAVKQVTQ
jgi:hypothetical protein